MQDEATEVGLREDAIAREHALSNNYDLVEE